MTDAPTPEAYIDRTVVDSDGTKIGSVGQVYVNDDSGIPDWVTVNTGLFGTKEHFVPLQGARFDGDSLVVPFGKDVVKDAPEVADASHLDADEQQDLYAYYQRFVGGTAGGVHTDGAVRTATDNTDTDTATATERTAVAATADAAGIDATIDTPNDESQHSSDDTMTRSEEHLKVGTERVESGRVRLRKYIVTEMQTITVPVSHEEIRIERIPIGEDDSDALPVGTPISEEEHEIILYAERPVVTTETVAVERVRLGTETVTGTQTISAEVRKEQIELHDDTDTGPTRSGTGDSAE